MTLKELCRYYINCIELESNTTMRVSMRDPMSFYVLPWVNDAALKLPDIGAFLRGSMAKEKDLLIGYPVLKAGTNLSPVFIMHVTYRDGTRGKPEGFTIDSELNVNKDIIDKYSSNEKTENIFELRQLESELGIEGSTDAFDRIETIVNLLRTLRPSWEWTEDLSLDNLHKGAMRVEEPDGILNRALVMAKEPTPYTVGLRNELARLSEYGESDIRHSILYKFLKGEIGKSAVIQKPILEVLPLNNEQKKAIQIALASDITLIAGPPGTGKTQVVANLIINAAVQHKTVLFTSKNNNAVDVVVKRVNGFNPTHPLVLRYEKSAKQCVTDYAQQWESLQVENTADSVKYSQYRRSYDDYLALQAKKDSVMQLRNQMDELDQAIDGPRSKYPSLVGHLTDGDVKQLTDALQAYLDSKQVYESGPKGLYEKLFRQKCEAQHKSKLDESLNALNVQLLRYAFPVQVTYGMSDREWTHFDILFQQLLADLQQLADYNFTARRLRDSASLEQLDTELLRDHAALQRKAQDYWNYWLDQHVADYSNDSRRELHNYISLLEHDEVDTFPVAIRGLLPVNAITSLSARRRLPFDEGVYDLLIIDEASQCDIASMIPLLLRAKRVVIIGDKQQLNHICLLNKQTDMQLLRNYNIAEARWSYRSNSIYDLAESNVSSDCIIQLRDHHRSFLDIIQFSNQEFYGDTLRIATDYRRLQAPDNGKPIVGVQWMNVIGQTVRPEKGGAYNLKEAEGVIRLLRRLTQELHFEGSIGVTTPFHLQAEMITRALEGDTEFRNALELHNQLLVDTVHKFQGDERDVIIFSPVVSQGAKPQSLQFLKSTGNLFNVAITRARALLVTVGDKEYCKHCGVSYLEHFADYNGGEQAPVESSEWEHMLQQALSDAGIPVTAQYHVDKYYLDLALFHNGHKLDIEVDGAMYHQAWNKELCYNDQLRNQALMRQGWDVMRFWVQQVRDELPWCLDQVRQWMERN